MTHSSALATRPTSDLVTSAQARAYRELLEGVDHMLTHFRVGSVEGLPHQARLYLATLFYAVRPDYMDDFSAGELSLHTTLLANLQADSKGSPDAADRQRAFYVRCQKWLIDYAISGIQKVLEAEGLD